ncbi:hypothetical protein [Microbacterium sp. 8M]|uniref:hypothetical protein n=1 Tax=Microbacterium sp. 8M TaxID=2653153 RepID=UPI001359FA64|nr:hypothetical protein [Microbacterium sp. 8M]
MFMGEVGSVKKATLNGLFAGKRKTLSITELAMLADALHVSMWDLIYPVGEEIEVRPGHFASAADALANDALVTLPGGRETTWSRVPGRIVETAEVVMAGESLNNHVTRAIAHARAGVGQDNHLASAAYEAFELRTRLGTYEKFYGDAPTLPESVRRVLAMSFNRNEVAQGGEAARAFELQLLTLEDLFVGVSIGSYQLGRGNGKHQAEA